MLTNYFFKDLYDDRWGNPANPNAADPPSPEGHSVGARGILGRLAGFLRRWRNRPSAWSFTIPSQMPDADGETDTCRHARNEDPKFLAIAKALSRNC